MSKFKVIYYLNWLSILLYKFVINGHLSYLKFKFSHHSINKQSSCQKIDQNIMIYEPQLLLICTILCRLSNAHFLFYTRSNRLESAPSALTQNSIF